MTSIALGLGALVFAFFLVLSDPQQGGQVMQQIQQTTSSLAPKTVNNPTALAPEARMDGSMPAPASSPQAISPQGTVRPEDATSSVESYLDSAWKTPQAASQANAMPNQFAQQPAMPFPGGMRPGGPQRMGNPRGFGPPGLERPQGLRQFFNQQPNSNQEQGLNQVRSSEEAVRYELGVARNEASGAYSCLDRVRGAEESSEKQSAAAEARSHASQASAAASRAVSRAGSVPELQGLLAEVRATADRAQDYANQASSAASGW